MITTVDSLVETISKKIKDRNANIVARRGSVVHDTFVIPAAAALSWNSSLLEFTKAQLALDTILAAKSDTELLLSVAEALTLSVDAALQLLSTSIDRMASNYGLVRKSAQYATGLVHFYTQAAPGSDISVPAGTTVETAQKVQFATTTTVALLQDTISDFYDPSLNAYAISAPVTALLSGPNSNVSASTILYPTGSMPAGFSGVTNKYSVTNGIGAESDEELAARIKITLRGSNLETKAGLAALILNNTTVRSIFIADAQSPYQYRNSGKGGVVDIYTADVIPAAIVENATYTSDTYLLQHQPVIDIISIPGYSEGVDYTLVTDTNPLTRESYRANTYIQWSGAHPVGAYTIEYAYNQVIEAIQALVTADAYRPLMGDVTSAVLARAGIKVNIQVSFQVVVHGGYSRAQVLSDATVAVQGYVNSLGFGQALAQSDIIGILETIPGINYVYATPLAFNRIGSAITNVITAADYEYLRVSELVIL